jgi:polygalacturonase
MACIVAARATNKLDVPNLCFHSGGMSDDNRTVSRRQWVAMASAPALAATLIGAPAAVAQEKAEGPALLRARVYNVRDFGAAGDGATLDTAAVQKAIDQCAAERGGTVLVPAGDFLVGTLELKSHVTLHLASNGRLLGSPRIDDYRAGNNIPRGNGNIVLISAADAENVTIEGRGTIDGNGAKFYTGKGDNTGPGQDSSAGYFARPHLLIFARCTNLLIRDVYLTASAYHCCRILNCRYVRLDGVRINNRVNKNNDGFHFNSSEFVNIVNCNIRCQDDACALFGSNRFVTVTNCSFSTRWSIFRFGGGSPQDIAISNCLIYETYGCPIKISMRRGGRMQNVSFSNLMMRDVTGPISIGLSSAGRRSSSQPTTAATAPSTQPLGVIRNLSFSNIRATVVAVGRQHEDLPFDSAFREGETHTCIVVNGATERDVIENVSFNDVHITYEGGGTREEAAREVPAMAGEYFEIGTPPAFGLYARNARGLTLQNVRFDVQKLDARPAIVFDHVDDAVINGLTTAASEGDATFRFVNASNVLVTAPRVVGKAAAFLRVEGEATQRIKIDGGDISSAATPVVATAGAAEKSATLRN